MWIQYGSGILLLAIFWVVIGRMGSLSWNHVFSVRVFLFPPAWIAGVLGFFLFEGVLLPRIGEWTRISQGELNWQVRAVPAGSSGPVQGELRFAVPTSARWDHPRPSLESNLLTAAVFVAIGLCTCLPRMGSGTRRRDEGATMPSGSILKDPVALKRWIEHDRPIESQEEDLFGTSQVAKRIASVLLTEQARAVGLLGRYGSGKSSTLNLVEAELRARKNSWHKGEFLIARLDTWGRSDEVIPTVVLRAAVRVLARQVDCTALARLPEAYAFAMGKDLPWWLKFLVQLGFSSETPHESLQRLDRVLKTAGMRMVIFTEDIERNIDAATCETSLPAFLDRLGHLECVSFVFATVGAPHSEVIRRTCQWIEVIS